MQCEKCRKALRPIVALDVDGTLADYHGHFIDFALKWLRRDWKHFFSVVAKFNENQDLAAALNINKDLYRTIKLAYRQGGQKRFQPTLGPVASLFDVIHAYGCDIWITTTRPYNRFDSTDPDTRDWLEYHTSGQKWEGLIYDDNKYEVLAEIVGPDRVSLVVDDLAGNCVTSQRLGMPTVQFGTRYNESTRWDGPVVLSFLDIPKWIERSIKHADN